MFVQYTIKTRVCVCVCLSASTKLLQQQQFSISVVSPPAFKFSAVAVIVISVPPSSSICMKISLSRFSLCLSLRYAMQALLTASTDNAQKPIANRVLSLKPLCRLIKQRRRSGNTSAWQFLLVVGKRVVNGVTCFHLCGLCASARPAWQAALLQRNFNFPLSLFTI